MVIKSFKTGDHSGTRWMWSEKLICHNPLLEDDQVMVEQVEQSADEQDERIKDAEIDIITWRKKMKKRKRLKW